MTTVIALTWLGITLWCLICTWFLYQENGVKHWKTWVLGLITLISTVNLIESVYGV